MIDVAFTYADVRPARVAVVIDVLRATSTIVQALSSGYGEVLVVPDVARAATLGAPGRVLAGEVRCERPPGFDLGNSPQETDPARAAALVLATTNGAPAIVAAAGVAEQVLIGALLNLDAVIAAIDGDDVLVVCAGTDGVAGIDDIYVAGRICARLQGERSDRALVAQAVAGSYATAVEAIGAGAAAANLLRVGLTADVAFCARESTTSVVARLTGLADGIAAVRADGTHKQNPNDKPEHFAVTL